MGWTKYLWSCSGYCWSNWADLLQRLETSHLGKWHKGHMSHRRGRLTQGMLEEGCRREAGRWQALGYISDILEIFKKYIGWFWRNSPSLEVGRECWLPRRWRAPSSRGSTIGLTSPPPPSRPPPPPPRQSAWVHLLMDRTVDEQSQRCPRHSDWGARVQTAPPCHSEGKGWLPDEWKIAQMGIRRKNWFSLWPSNRPRTPSFSFNFFNFQFFFFNSPSYRPRTRSPEAPHRSPPPPRRTSRCARSGSTWNFNWEPKLDALVKSFRKVVW